MGSRTDVKSLPGYEKRWLGLVFIGIALIVISLDNMILNTALPAISGDLEASASELQWIVDSYILMFAALILTMGALGDRFGRKRALQVGLVMFGVGSAAAGLSGSTLMLIVARGFLGMSGAVIMPATLSIISATFPQEERAKAIAVWAAIFGLGIGIGPVAGGWLIQEFEWSAVFFVNLPVIVIALVGGAKYLADSRDETTPRIDIPGILLSIPGLFALLYGIIEAGVDGWGATNVLVAFAIAAVLLTAFAVWESRAKEPMLQMSFFKNMSFTGANLSMVLMFFAMFGAVFFLTQYLQSVLGFTALEAGIRMLPLAGTFVVVSGISAVVADKLGTKLTVALGIFITGIGLLYMSQFFEVDSSYGTVALSMIIMPFGIGLTMSPGTNSIMQSVPVNKAGIGSAMNDTTRQLGGALGVAVLGTVMNNSYLGDIHAVKSALSGEAFEFVSSSVQGAHIIANTAQLSDATRELVISTANQAFVTGMNSAVVVGAIIMFVASILTLAILPAKVRGPEGETAEEAAARLAPVAAAGD